MPVQPYLFFNGRTEEALNFYREAIGASIEMLVRNRDAPAPPVGCPPGSGEQVLHAAFRVGDSVLLASDGPVPGGFNGFALSLAAADDADARRKFDALAAGGTVDMPLAETFFASAFGMLVDRFGVHWMVLHPKPMP
ncbi:MAG: VOC family protein [Lysobacteraceae bacterium]